MTICIYTYPVNSKFIPTIRYVSGRGYMTLLWLVEWRSRYNLYPHCFDLGGGTKFNVWVEYIHTNILVCKSKSVQFLENTKNGSKFYCFFYFSLQKFTFFVSSGSRKTLTHSALRSSVVCTITSHCACSKLFLPLRP